MADEVSFSIKQVNISGRWVPTPLSSKPYAQAWHCELCTDELSVMRLTAGVTSVPSESEGWFVHTCDSCHKSFHDQCLRAFLTSMGKEFACASCGGKVSTFNPIALAEGSK